MSGDELPPFTVHIAGVPDSGVQRCVPCGTVLVDNTAWFEGRVAIPIGQEDTGPGWWPVSGLVATDKQPGESGITYVVDGRGLADDEQVCAPSR